jgi:hypothetical protein
VGTLVVGDVELVDGASGDGACRVLNVGPAEREHRPVMMSVAVHVEEARTRGSGDAGVHVEPTSLAQVDHALQQWTHSSTSPSGDTTVRASQQVAAVTEVPRGQTPARPREPVGPLPAFEYLRQRPS